METLNKYLVFLTDSSQIEVNAERFHVNYDYHRVAFFQEDNITALFNFNNIIGFKRIDDKKRAL